MILAFESTAKVASVALLDKGKIIAEYSVDCGLTQSELLLPMAEHCLSSVHKDFSDLTAVACTVGPGSFTGVRIGAATVKGIAFSKGLPCLAVSTLEALAENLRGIKGIFAAVMDARRGQVYNAIFSSNGDEIKRLTPDRAIAIDALADALSAYKGENIYLVGDGYDISFNALTSLDVSLCQTPRALRNERADACAFVAKRLLEEGKAVSDSQLSPTYLRVPQAERERLERENAQK